MGTAAVIALAILLLFPLSLVCEAAATSSLGHVGYIPVESVEKAHEISKELLNNKWVQNSVVVPISLQNPQSETVPNAPHLLLIETTAELIPNVKSAVNEAYKDKNAPPILFSPASSKIPYLQFSPSLGSGPVAAAEASGEAEASGTEVDKKLRRTEQMTEQRLDITPQGPNQISVTARVGTPFTLLVLGNPTTGYQWEVDRSTTSPSLRVGSFQEFQRVRPDLMGSPTIFSLDVAATRAGEHVLKLEYIRSWSPTEFPVFKTVHVTAVM